MRDRVSVAYVVRSWPRLSQTFIINEVLALEHLGVRCSIFALARSGEAIVQPQVAGVRAAVRVLAVGVGARWRAHARVATRAPARYVRALFTAHANLRLFGGYTTSSPGQAFSAAVVLAAALQAAHPNDRPTHIHAHFAHDPALVALLASELTGLPFTFTAHARDLYQIPAAALRERVRRASATVTCCRSNLDYIRRLVPAASRVELVYHGVDLHEFAAADRAPSNGTPLIVSVGRLVEKKGFDDLLEALAVIARDGRRFRGEIYGDGPDRSMLEGMRDRLGLRGFVDFCGAQTQTQLLPAYRRADVFALAPRVTRDGDRDGVPNVVLEAMACALPVVCTRVGGVGEVVRNGQNGLLVEARDTGAIAAGIASLLDDPVERRRLGDGARATALAFDVRAAAFRLAVLFEAQPGGMR